MNKNENGYIVVETIGAFVPFVMLVISILSLVNIVTVQARVHYALTQAANSVSMYSYTLEVLGIANNLTTLSNKADRVSGEANAMRDDINSVLGGIDSLSAVFGAAQSIGSIADRALGWGEDVAGDPQGSLQLLMNYGLSELRSFAFEQLVRPMVGRYLSNGAISGDEYLRRAGVVDRRTGEEGLRALQFYRMINFGRENSELIDTDGNIRLAVEYEIMYTFAGIRLPFSPTLRVKQTVVTKAWLNGSGEGYRKT